MAHSPPTVPSRAEARVGAGRHTGGLVCRPEPVVVGLAHLEGLVGNGAPAVVGPAPPASAAMARTAYRLIGGVFLVFALFARNIYKMVKRKFI